MPKRRFAQRLLCLLLPVCLLPGCQTFRGDQTVTVLVCDAETKKPIATAEVYLCQRLKDDEVAPCRMMVLTQEDGIARLRGESDAEHGYQVQAVAQGYLPEKVNVASASANGRRQSSAKKDKPAGKKDKPADKTDRKAGKNDKLAGAGQSPPEQSPDNVIVEVYAQPDFSVELVLPPGYRGLVKAEIQVQDNVPLPAGQRCFSFPVSASGDVRVQGPSLLRRVDVQSFQARYGNGPLLGTSMDAEKVGFRWLKGVGNQQFYVVGTQLDYETLHRQVAPEETQPTFGSGDDAAQAVHEHKYKYGKMTAKNYEK